jgi:hypothetical protein
MEKLKSGKDFEELVTWIHQCLHDKATITPNEKILDVHSKRPRQIDISIRIKDGPTSFFGIVEVRDRSRPVGEDYIEQIHSKRESVGADAAFIVSSSGFYAAAVEKARALNIRIFTYKEAVASDWMQCLQLKEITQFIRRWDNAFVLFLEPSTNQIISPHKSITDALQKNVAALILTTDQNEPKRSIPQIIDQVVNENFQNFFEGIALGERQRKRGSVILQTGPNESPLFFRDVAGVLRKLDRFYFEADFFMEAHKTPVHLSRYCNAGTGEAIAEVASATIQAWGGTHNLQFIAKFSGEEGSQLLMRLQKQDQSKLSG